ncbi:TIGR04283 family arsenosugar biosynthesis glycosyltransferase [Aquimarina sp. AU474]|uniref:TIGR04283 family arsenosugar biosynthesis glycosyltransferase n=1 Tax=Aquimarina sp. AU474 TaxID=2108529 RepID=UPI000D698E9B|nr:TIGR04283 family arsenosugar biosynthesis glycosyltransferase [Aquimarina sp. AU474]
MKISIVIPILNEAATIRTLLSHLINNTENTENILEVIVVDGGSVDQSQEVVRQLSVQQNPSIKLICSDKGRAKQLNAGAKAAKGEVLYFLHADSYPPKGYDQDILKEIEKENIAGCFRMKFDSKHPWLLFLGWLTQFQSKRCRGGDQSQFITKQLFEEINGYDESYIVYEDNDLVDRLFDIDEFVIIPKYVITSARRYREIGVWRLQYHFLNIHMRRWMGASSEDLYQYYKEKVIS